jgi:L-asparaginase
MIVNVKPRIAVVATGGTISGVGEGPLDYFDYATRGRFMQGDELVARLPLLADQADIEVVSYKNVASSDIGPPDWLSLSRIIQDAVKARNAAGIVVTHGTSSLEETAYFLNLTLRVDVPVVVTGAQRPASALGTDAQLNLLNAVQVAKSADAKGMGVLVVLNGEINAAREVTKSSTLRSQAFQSQDLGLLGYVDGEEVTFYRRPQRVSFPDTEFRIEDVVALPRVDLIPSYGGADGIQVEAALNAGCEGLVAMALAPGVVPRAQQKALEHAVERGVIVVMSSRVGSGRITDARSAIPEAGMIAADTLSPQKARILLMLALTRTRDVGEIRRIFRQY